MKNRYWLPGKIGLAAMVLGLAALVSLPALARGGKGRGGPPSAENRLDHLTKVLDLTDAQQEAILPILKAEDEEVKALRDKYKDSSREERQGMRDEMRSIHDKYASQIEAELNDQQKEKFQEMREKMQQHRGPHGQGKGKGRGGPASDGGGQ